MSRRSSDDGRLGGIARLQVALQVLQSGVEHRERRAQLVTGVGDERALRAQRIARADGPPVGWRTSSARRRPGSPGRRSRSRRSGCRGRRRRSCPRDGRASNRWLTLMCASTNENAATRITSTRALVASTICSPTTRDARRTAARPGRSPVATLSQLPQPVALSADRW